MTHDERDLIADVLRQRIVEIKKMFQTPDWEIPKEEIPQAIKVQIAALAGDLDSAFRKRDPAFGQFFLGAVRSEMNRGLTL